MTKEQIGDPVDKAELDAAWSKVMTSNEWLLRERFEAWAKRNSLNITVEHSSFARRSNYENPSVDLAWEAVLALGSPDETAACRYEASIGSICNKCGRIHDFGTERCAECQTPRLCGAERECLRNRYVRPAWETSPAPSNRPCEHRELRRDEIDGAWFCVEPRCTFELPTVETSGDDQLVRDTIAQNTRLLSALTKVTESWVNGRRVMDGIPASVAQEVREALKLQSKETNDYTKVPEVMNPPASAAQGAEARNLTRANVMGLEEAQRATETRPVNVAPLPSIGDECPVCAYGRIGQSQGNFRCGNCGWLGPSVPSPENGPASHLQQENKT